MASTKPLLYNPETGYECSYVKKQDDNSFCVVENSYDVLSPIAVLFGFILIDNRITPPSAKQEKAFLKFLGYGYLMAESAWSYLFPTTQTIPDIKLVEEYSKIIDQSQHHNPFKNYNNTKAAFESFSANCKNQYGFIPFTPPSFGFFDKTLNSENITTQETYAVYDFIAKQEEVAVSGNLQHTQE